MASAAPRSDSDDAPAVESGAERELRDQSLVAWLEEHPDEADPTRPGAGVSLVEGRQIVRDRGGRLGSND